MKIRRLERGLVAVFLGLTIALLGAFLAASLNVAQLMWRRSQLQNATDAGALAGAKVLDGSLAGITTARLTAEEYTERHLAGNHFVEIDPFLDIEVGEWTPNGGFTPMNPSTAAEARLVNAVSVKSDREDNVMKVWFAGLLRAETVSVGANATAIGGGPCEGCSFPVAIPECQVVDDNTGNLMCNAHFVFNPDGQDTAGFTSLSLSPTNTNVLRDILNNPDSCADVAIGDDINVQNGNELSPLKNLFAQRIGELVTVPIISANRDTDGNCAPKFNQDNPVVGFGTMRVIDVVVEGSVKRIEIEFVCNESDSGETEQGGCGRHFGTTAPQVALVD